MLDQLDDGMTDRLQPFGQSALTPKSKAAYAELCEEEHAEAVGNFGFPAIAVCSCDLFCHWLEPMADHCAMGPASTCLGEI